MAFVLFSSPRPSDLGSFLTDFPLHVTQNALQHEQHVKYFFFLDLKKKPFKVNLGLNIPLVNVLIVCLTSSVINLTMACTHVLVLMHSDPAVVLRMMARAHVYSFTLVDLHRTVCWRKGAAQGNQPAGHRPARRPRRVQTPRAPVLTGWTEDARRGGLRPEPGDLRNRSTIYWKWQVCDAGQGFERSEVTRWALNVPVVN